jgi:TRAP-type C4-dicarboxylate transport system substrate-binding protein
MRAAQHRHMTRSGPISTLAVSLVLLAIAAAGCGGSGKGHSNKAGAAVTQSQTITIQAPDPGDPEIAYLAKRIAERSGGSLHVRIGDRYDSILASNEVRLARAVLAGREDFALVAARAWSGAGVRAFAALQAPFVITTNEAARAAMEGPAGRTLAADLRKAGVEPLALVPTQLRRLLATRPLATPASFRGARLRIIDNATTAQEIAALGAIPKQGYRSTAVLTDLKAGRLDGAETAPRPILNNNYSATAKRLTGYALFDKVDSFVASPSALKRLSPDQRTVLREAAGDLKRFSARESALETDDIGRLCRDGVRVDTPSGADLRALVAATAPVRAALERDPAAGPVMRLLSATPGAGARPLPPPATCTSPSAPPPSAGAKASIPTGTYTLTLTPQDFHHYGVYGEISNRTRLNTTRFSADGRFTYSIKPEFGPAADRCPCGGNYKLSGKRLTFDWDRPDWPDDRVSWSYYRGKLSFTNIDTGDPQDTVYYALPWRKVR